MLPFAMVPTPMPMLPSFSGQWMRSDKLFTVLGGFCFLLALFSETGYFFFLSSVSEESLRDPLEKFVHIHVNEKTWNHLISAVAWIVYSCSTMQSLATLLGILDIKEKMRNFKREGVKAMQKIRESNCMYLCFFLCHMILTLTVYVTGASIPWLGLLQYGYRGWKCNLLGIGMFLGQIILYCLSYIDAVFATPHKMIEFVSSGQLRITFCHCFNPFTIRKDRWGFRLRTIAQMITEAWFYFGTYLLFQDYVLPPGGGEWIAYIVAFCAAYNALTSQGPVKDYQNTFERTNGQAPEVEKKNCWTQFLYTLLFTPVLLSHIIPVPALFTGTIYDPQTEYTPLVMSKAAIGFILGGYAGYQYTYEYLFYLVKEGLHGIAPKASKANKENASSSLTSICIIHMPPITTGPCTLFHTEDNSSSRIQDPLGISSRE
jgi:hypothetical protein